MEQFGVARNTVRDPVQALVGIGVLDVRPGRGTLVRSVDAPVLDNATVSVLLDDQAIDDLYELRFLIEVEVAAHAAERGSEETIAEIRRALARNRGEFTRGPTYAADFDFHRAIARATRNPVYGRVRTVLNAFLVSTRRRTDSVARAREIVLAGHVEIFEAIAARNAAAARDPMRWHILQAIAVMHEALGSGAPR